MDLLNYLTDGLDQLYLTGPTLLNNTGPALSIYLSMQVLLRFTFMRGLRPLGSPCVVMWLRHTAPSGQCVGLRPPLAEPKAPYMSGTGVCPPYICNQKDVVVADNFLSVDYFFCGELGPKSWLITL